MWVLVWVCYDYERERVNERVHVCVHVCPLFPSSLWWWVRQRLGAIGGIWQGHGMFQKYLELRTQVNDTHVLPSPRVITQIKKNKRQGTRKWNVHLSYVGSLTDFRTTSQDRHCRTWMKLRSLLLLTRFEYSWAGRPQLKTCFGRSSNHNTYQACQLMNI